MKTLTTMKQTFLVLAIALSIVSCKKDKQTDPDTKPPIEVKTVTFTDLKALSTGASVKVPDGKKITGIVISDVSKKNIDAKTVILQEATDKPAIIINFDAAQSFALGDEVEVNISNQTLANVKGEVVLNNIPAANAKKTATGGTIAAKTTTAAAIVINKAAWDGTLVTLPVTSLTGGSGKFTGTLTFSDGTTEIKSSVLAGATFENNAYPPSVSSLTGIVRVNDNEIRVDIRSASDIVTGAISRIVTEDWTNLTGDVNQDFTTAVGSYSPYPLLNNYFSYSTAITGDESFTTVGKKYLYINKSGNYYLFFNNTGADLSGLKTVTVTVAASKSFSMGADSYMQISISPQNIPGGRQVNLALLFLSPQIKETGKFYTITWTLPTKEQMIAAGASNDPTGNPDGLGGLDYWLKRPSFLINNTSVNTDDPENAPILIEKIEFAY